ncbi:hypothetical protein HZA57_07775, partial [Candidatus Poribacteria bacterium]|nr:hypothetical protein [Candidatus Poribacteria bacterium]
METIRHPLVPNPRRKLLSRRLPRRAHLVCAGALLAAGLLAGPSDALAQGPHIESLQ